MLPAVNEQAVAQKGTTNSIRHQSVCQARKKAGFQVVKNIKRANNSVVREYFRSSPILVLPKTFAGGFKDAAAILYPHE